MEEPKANIVIEMMGRPKAHLSKTMRDFVKRLSSEEGVEIIGEKIHNPKKIEQKDKEGKVIKFEKGQELYSNFAELEIQTNTLFKLISIVFTYMPSHIEIIEPRDFKIENFDLSAILNEITKKLHQYDAIAKNSIMQNRLLAKKLMILQQELGSKNSGVEIMGTDKSADKNKSKKKNKK